MRKIIQVLAAVAVISAVSPAFAQPKAETDAKDSAKVIVYYFHDSFRCYTCNNMEKYSREAVETNFKKKLASGKIEFKAVNVEEQGNEHFIKDYNLYTKSLILSLVIDGKEVKSKNLDKIWQLARNKKKFINYVTGEIKTFIKDAH
ncbi:MAG: hypothetical protein BWY26_00243 [Elusimicrobia bacterium ADurb.Bin231]|nr:MAG: hypothetical protein BWY26_00243 [Elusimicrobia bacterium ADurb.Bin231]